MSQGSFTQSNTNECMQNRGTHVTNSPGLVKSEKPVDSKPQSSSNFPPPTISMPTSPAYTPNPNQNMFSQTPQPYFPYLSPPHPNIHTLYPPNHTPYEPTLPPNLNPWPKLNVAPSESWMYSQFNFRPSLKDTKIHASPPWPGG